MLRSYRSEEHYMISIDVYNNDRPTDDNLASFKNFSAMGHLFGSRVGFLWSGWG